MGSVIVMGVMCVFLLSVYISQRKQHGRYYSLYGDQQPM